MGVARMKAEAPGRLRDFRRPGACARARASKGRRGPRGSAQEDIAIASTDPRQRCERDCSLAKSMPQDFSKICLEIKCSVAITHGG